MSKQIRALALVLVALLMMGGLAACGGDDSASSSTTQARQTTTTTAAVFNPGSGSTDTTNTTQAGGNDQQQAINNFMSGLNSEISPDQTGDTYTFTQLTDDTGQLTVEAPQEWTDVDGRVGHIGNLTLPDIQASTDLSQYRSGFDVPGFEFAATDQSSTGDVNRVLDEYVRRFSQTCDRSDRQDYDDPLYTGVFQVFTNCGGTSNGFVQTVVEPKDTTDGFYIASVGVQVTSQADIDALGHILDTFVVTPSS